MSIPTKSTLHIYTRVSTAVQKDEGTSLQTQKELGKRKSKELGFDFHLWDEGGKSSKYEDLDNRPELKKLLMKVEDGEVQHLWVYNNDRLSRNEITQQTIRIALQKQGVKLYTKDGEFDLTNPTDKLLKTILDGIAQYDNALRTERSRLGKLNKVRQGFWMGGPPPYGYKIQDKKLIETPDESRWIKKIYQWKSDGKPIHWIKNELDKNGVQTRHGKGLWSIGSIQKILRNTHYIGHYAYNPKKLDESVDCHCPSIMDDRLWNSVQERREKTKERKGQNNRTRRFYFLRNLMFCGHCGRPMSGRIKPSKDERLYYCPDKERNWQKTPPSEDEKWVRDRGCKMTRSLNIPRTDELVWESVIGVMSDSEILRKRMEDFIGGEENYEEDRKKEIKKEKKLKKELQKIDGAISQIEVDRRLERMDADLYRKVRQRFDDAKTKVKEDLKQSKKQIKEIGNREKWLNAVSRLQASLEEMEAESEEEKKLFLEMFVERIDVCYDQSMGEHELTIKFLLPLVDSFFCVKGDRWAGRHDKEVILPPNKTIPLSPSVSER